MTKFVLNLRYGIRYTSNALLLCLYLPAPFFPNNLLSVLAVNPSWCVAAVLTIPVKW